MRLVKIDPNNIIYLKNEFDSLIGSITSDGWFMRWSQFSVEYKSQMDAVFAVVEAYKIEKEVEL